MIKGSVVRTTNEYNSEFGDKFIGEVLNMDERGVVSIAYDKNESYAYHTDVDSGIDGVVNIHVSWLERV